MPEINPWGSELVTDYDKLFKEFGLQPITPELLKKIGLDYRGFRRGIIFAHRDFDKFVEATEKGRKTAVMSGIKPSSEFHLGSKMTAEEIIYLQKRFGSTVFYAVADYESYADNGISFEDAHEFAVDNVADLLALGLDEKNAVIYKQSECLNVMRLGHVFSNKVTPNMMTALYGHQKTGLYNAVFIQMADILQPQLKQFGGANFTVVPVGVDQDPHIRLTRDIAGRTKTEFGFIPPAATYHKFFRALNGETKMSKRDPMNVLTLNDSPELVKKKVNRALTGGRDTEKEQREKGGDIKKCVVYELMLYHFYEDDLALEDMKDECLQGKILCGECKLKRIKVIQDYLKKHQEKKKKMQSKARKILEQ
ncbi:MAG: tryptophan--tRNA ligase [Candidatus Micrarchaeota archaeon]